MTIKTGLTRLLGIRLPILAAPHADPLAVLAAAAAGGIGILAAGPNVHPAVARLSSAGSLFAVDGPVLEAQGGALSGPVRLHRVDDLVEARKAVAAGAQALVVSDSKVLDAVAGAGLGLPLVAAWPVWDPDALRLALQQGADGIEIGLGDAAALAERVGALVAGLDGPALTPGKLQQRAERQQREAAALRMNLLRRKAQARNRAE